MSAPEFTILLPIHRSPELLEFAVASVLGQSRQDFELFIICDGAPEATVAAAQAYAAQDGRIRACVHPKGARLGEAWRHQALGQASGRIVCQIADDDLWLPDHLEHAGKALDALDFGHTLQLMLFPGSEPGVLFGDLADATTRQRILDTRENLFGPTVAFYRRAVYDALPEGWAPAPEGVYSDLWMWRKFLSRPELRAGTCFAFTAIMFPATLREGWSLARRKQEMQSVSQALGEPGFRDHLWRCGMAAVANRVRQVTAENEEAAATRRRLKRTLGASALRFAQIAAAEGDSVRQTEIARDALQEIEKSG